MTRKSNIKQLMVCYLFACYSKLLQSLSRTIFLRVRKIWEKRPNKIPLNIYKINWLWNGTILAGRKSIEIRLYIAIPIYSPKLIGSGPFLAQTAHSIKTQWMPPNFQFNIYQSIATSPSENLKRSEQTDSRFF